VLPGCAYYNKTSVNQVYEELPLEEKTSDVQSNGLALVSWSKICKPKNHGGLGVLDLFV
jgi:hypothetical protein